MKKKTAISVWTGVPRSAASFLCSRWKKNTLDRFVSTRTQSLIVHWFREWRWRRNYIFDWSIRERIIIAVELSSNRIRRRGGWNSVWPMAQSTIATVFIFIGNGRIERRPTSERTEWIERLCQRWKRCEAQTSTVDSEREVGDHRVVTKVLKQKANSK